MTHVQHAWPSDTADRIKAMRDSGATWRAVGNAFGVSHMAVFKKALSLGLGASKKYRRFTSEEDAALRADYLNHVDLTETAAKLGRSVETLRQRIFHYHKGLVHTRSQPVTMAIRRYGRQILELGATADEGAKVFRERIAEAKTAARRAAAEAKTRRINMKLETMLAEIEAGKARDAAIFEARAAGVSLNKIASCFNLTRERIRQICNEEAVIRATKPTRHPRPVEKRVAA